MTTAPENLGFGKVTLLADEQQTEQALSADSGIGNGDKLASYLSEQSKIATIAPFGEELARNSAEIAQPNAV